MPRQRLISGNYGQANAAQESLDQIPLPESPQVQAGGGGVPAEVSSTLSAAEAEAPPAGGFGDPTKRPREAVTAGLPVGAGPGPAVLGPARNPNRISEHFELMSMLAGGDAALSTVARRARVRGL